MIQIVTSLVITLVLFFGGIKFVKAFNGKFNLQSNSNKNILPSSKHDSNGCIEIEPMYGTIPSDEDGIEIEPMYGTIPSDEDGIEIEPMYGYIPCEPYQKIDMPKENYISNKFSKNRLSKPLYTGKVELTKKNKRKLATNNKYNLFISGDNRNWKVNPVSANKHHPKLFIAPNKNRNVDTIDLCDGWKLNAEVGLKKYSDIIKLNQDDELELVESNFPNYPKIFKPTDISFETLQTSK